MSKLRVGDRVLVQLGHVKHGMGPPRLATFEGQGKDSGGPWVLVEYLSDRARELVHPVRVTPAPKDSE